MNGGTATLTVNVTNVITGATRSVTRTRRSDRFFELVPSVVQEVVRYLLRQASALLLRAGLGLDSVKDGSDFTDFSWSGNVRLKYTGDLEPGDEPPGEYARYSRVRQHPRDVGWNGRRVLLSRHGGRDDRPSARRTAVAACSRGCQPTYSLVAAYPDGTPPMP